MKNIELIMESIKLNIINDQNMFKKITQDSKPVIFVFEKQWSGACQLMRLVLKKIERNYSNSIQIIHIDLEKNPQLAKDYRIINVPTLLFIKNGILLDKISGIIPFEELKIKLKSIL